MATTKKIKDRLLSKLDHPVELSYDGKSMMVPPRAKLVIEDHKKLGALPRGVVLLKGK